MGTTTIDGFLVFSPSAYSPHVIKLTSLIKHKRSALLHEKSGNWPPGIVPQARGEVRGLSHVQMVKRAIEGMNPGSGLYARSYRKRWGGVEERTQWPRYTKKAVTSSAISRM